MTNIVGEQSQPEHSCSVEVIAQSGHIWDWRRSDRIIKVLYHCTLSLHQLGWGNHRNYSSSLCLKSDISPIWIRNFLKFSGYGLELAVCRQACLLLDRMKELGEEQGRRPGKGKERGSLPKGGMRRGEHTSWLPDRGWEPTDLGPSSCFRSIYILYFPMIRHIYYRYLVSIKCLYTNYNKMCFKVPVSVS